MADFTPVTIENYYELQAALLSGASSVSYSHPGGNKSVTYRSLDEMFRLLKYMAGLLGLTPPRRGRTFAAVSKGYTHGCNNATEGGECFGVDGRCGP